MSVVSDVTTNLRIIKETHDADGTVTKRGITPDGREVITIESFNPNEVAYLRDKALTQSRDRIRQAIPSMPQNAKGQAVVNENPAIPKVYENPFNQPLNNARDFLYDPLEETSRLLKKKLPKDFNESNVLEMLLPFDRTGRVKK